MDEVDVVDGVDYHYSEARGWPPLLFHRNS